MGVVREESLVDEVLSRSGVVGCRVSCWRPMRWWLISLVALAVWLAPGGEAQAQGTFGGTPEPMTSSDLELVAERLWLSESQILSMIDAHDQYKRDFRKLREGKIQELIDRMLALRPTEPVMPDLPPRSEVESLIELHESITRRAKGTTSL